MNWITDTRPATKIGLNRIQPPQNGLLLSSDLHAMFDLFLISVAPDVSILSLVFLYGEMTTNDTTQDGYKIVDFSGAIPELDGAVLSRTARNPSNSNDRVSDDVLRWHLKCAVLANMKGIEREEVWEFDLDSSDEIGAIMEGLDAAERMELELFTRLGVGQLVSVHNIF